ncbi:MAG: protein prkA, partial [Firmicutes bacterium]|nr:protein prkA [Bacillota bacterium]
MSLLARLEEYRQEEERLAWEGTFGDYFELVRTNPHLVQHSHSRIYNMIRSTGTEEAGGSRRYHFFSKELFGLDEALQRLVEEYFHSAARRLDVRKRIRLLMGPVSGGKSTIVTLLKRGLEGYSRTWEGALFAIKDCPMHEEPLHLVPSELREEVEKEYGLRIEGSLCPSCRLRLQEEYGGVIERVRARRIFL